MNTCDRNNGRRLLEGTLQEAELQTVLRHLETCRQCQEWLEQEAGSDEDWSNAAHWLQGSREMVCWSDGSPVEKPSPDTSSHSSVGAPAVPTDLTFLAPTDDPAYKGRIGTYEVVGVIGRGGMGIVLKALDRTLNRFVAVKVLDPSMAGTGAARQRFAREARAMAALSHEHVVPIYAVDEHGGLPYFAMEYVPGGTLASRLNSEGALDVESIERIAIQVARALAAAHESGLVHRDIKPANILLDRGIERVRVADFGLARIANDAGCTGSGMLAGTPQYMAPEQVRGETCNALSDLFSLGSVMYAMCTGHGPFRSETVYGAMHRIVHDEPRPLREQNPQIPSWLAEFIFRLLAKSPAERFQSAEDLASLLEQELAHLQNPVMAPVPQRDWMNKRFEQRPTRSRIWKWGAAFAVLLVSVGIFCKVWLNESNPPKLATEVALPQSDIPTWEADGFAALKDSANALEHQFRVESLGPSSDPWQVDIGRVHQELKRIEKTLP